MSTGAENPRDLLYHPAHDWVRIDGTTATFGVTWFAQSQLGEIVYWDPPQVGSRVVKDEPYSELESVKAVSDVLAPLSGVVLECNERVAAELTLINEDPYGDGWLVRVELSNPEETAALLSAGSYEELIA
jgi:glycine cleavage system H protein